MFSGWEEAVHQLIAANRIEINEVINSKSDAFLIQLTADDCSDPALDAGLAQIVREYTEAKRERPCLCDYLPRGVRTNQAVYDAIFSAVDLDYQVEAGAAEGVVATFPDRSLGFYRYQASPTSSFVDEVTIAGLELHDDSGILIEETDSGQVNLISPRERCAARLSPRWLRAWFDFDRSGIFRRIGRNLLVRLEFQWTNLSLQSLSRFQEKRFRLGTGRWQFPSFSPALRRFRDLSSGTCNICLC